MQKFITRLVILEDYQGSSNKLTGSGEETQRWARDKIRGDIRPDYYNHVRYRKLKLNKDLIYSKNREIH